MLFEVAHEGLSTESLGHEELVDAWMARSAAGASGPRLVELLDHALEALWRRAQQTLGDVTVHTIVARVVHQSMLRHPVLGPLQVEDGRVACGALQGPEVQAPEVRAAGLRAPEVDAGALAAALHFVLVELLTVLGQLTAQILTPALHDELWRVAAASPAQARQA